jgi:hypothetical protein
MYFATVDRIKDLLPGREGHVGAVPTGNPKRLTTCRESVELRALSLVSHGAGCAKDPPARNRYPLASGWFPRVLALEIMTAQRPAKDPRGHSPPHSRDECCQPLAGSAADRRTAQARSRRRPNHWSSRNP